MCEGVASAGRQHDWVVQPLENCTSKLRGNRWAAVEAALVWHWTATFVFRPVTRQNHWHAVWPDTAARRVPHVCLPCAVGQSAQFPSPHSSRRDAADAIIKRRRRPLRRYSWSDLTAPLVQSTEIQSRCSLALSDIVKTDNRIYIFKFDIRILEKSDINIPTVHRPTPGNYQQWVRPAASVECIRLPWNVWH